MIKKFPFMSNLAIGACLIIIMVMPFYALSQEGEPNEKVYHFDGSLSATNNGFSNVPTFSLGKPATVADLSIGGKKFSFDPQIRFEIEGLKPWSFIFIWRYQLIKSDKWSVKLGAHLPAISFRRQSIVVDSVTYEQVFTQRWCTPELTATYQLTKHMNIGTYYLHGIGLEKTGQVSQMNFISLRMGFNNLPLTENWFMGWNPQVYYLTMDELGGFFAAQTISLAHKKIPFSVSTAMNKSLESNNAIPANDFDWNVSLIYTFKTEWSKK